MAAGDPNSVNKRWIGHDSFLDLSPSAEGHFISDRLGTRGLGIKVIKSDSDTVAKPNTSPSPRARAGSSPIKFRLGTGTLTTVGVKVTNPVPRVGLIEYGDFC